MESWVNAGAEMGPLEGAPPMTGKGEWEGVMAAMGTGGTAANQTPDRICGERE